MGENNRIKELIARIKGIRNIEWIIAALILSLIFLLFFGSGEEQAPTAEGSASAVTAEEKLAKTLSSIKGVGNVKVFLLYEKGETTVPAYNTQTQTNVTKETKTDGTVSEIRTENVTSSVVIVSNQGKNEALILQTEHARIGGVIVVAQGAQSMEVRLRLVNAVKTALNIETEKIEIFEMN